MGGILAISRSPYPTSSHTAPHSQHCLALIPADAPTPDYSRHRRSGATMLKNPPIPLHLIPRQKPLEHPLLTCRDHSFPIISSSPSSPSAPQSPAAFSVQTRQVHTCLVVLLFCLPKHPQGSFPPGGRLSSGRLSLNALLTAEPLLPAFRVLPITLTSLF